MIDPKVKDLMKFLTALGVIASGLVSVLFWVFTVAVESSQAMKLAGKVEIALADHARANREEILQMRVQHAQELKELNDRLSRLEGRLQR